MDTGSNPVISFKNPHRNVRVCLLCGNFVTLGKIIIMARPSEYNFDMCIEICSEVAEGYNIKTILRSKEEYPTFQTWCNWKRQHQELFDLYVKTMQDKAESEIEEIDNVYDMLKAGEIEPSVANVLIQTKKWTAAKFYPKMFGDKIQQEHSGEIKGTSIIPMNPKEAKEFLENLDKNI